MQHT